MNWCSVNEKERGNDSWVSKPYYFLQKTVCTVKERIVDEREVWKAIAIASLQNGPQQSLMPIAHTLVNGLPIGQWFTE